METTIANNNKYHEKMTLEKTTEFLLEYKSKSLPNNLDDRYHTLKRNIGFAWFDQVFKRLPKGNCPNIFF